MPRYFFDTFDGDAILPDSEGVELPDREAARKAAIAVLPDIARDELPDGDHRQFAAKIREEDGDYIFQATLSLEAGWLPGAR